MSDSQKSWRESTHPVLLDLLEGNKRWSSKNNELRSTDRDDPDLDHVNSQSPRAVVITCADSRVIPEFIFDTGVGELFVIRVAGNVVTEEVAASVEFAIIELSVEIVFVLGHQNCGAITAKIQHKKSETTERNPNLERLYSRLRIVLEDEIDEDDRITQSIKTNILFQHSELLEISEISEELTRKGKLIVLPAIYHLDSREVEIY